MRSIILGLTLLLSVSLVFGQRSKVSTPDYFEGTLTAFGSVKGTDGRWYSINGLKLPYVAERVKPSKMHLLRGRKNKGSSPSIGKRSMVPNSGQAHDLESFVREMEFKRLYASIGNAGAPVFDTIVYRSETGANGTYGMIDGQEFSDPSSLDDHLLSGGSGQLWKFLTFGVHISESRVFVCRWIIYDNFIANQGHNNSAFTGVVADFGVILAQDPFPIGNYVVPYPADDPPPSPTYHYFKINIAAAGITAPDNTVYMASQFRHRMAGHWTQEQGEGPFDQSQFNVYNIAVAPSIGGSDNNFWFDWDEQNGIYSEDELEAFDPGIAPFSNLLRAIETSGTAETCLPFNMATEGVSPTGELVDLWDSDDLYVGVKPMFNVNRTSPNASVIVDGITNNLNTTSLMFNCEAAATLAGGTRQIELWNYNTLAWDVVDSRPITSTDFTVSASVTTNIARYINQSNRRMRAKITFFAPHNVDRSYGFRVDRMIWVLTHP